MGDRGDLSMFQRLVRTICISMLLACTAAAANSTVTGPGKTGPLVDYHHHLLSPDAARLLAQSEGGEAQTVTLPADVAEMLRQRTAAWNNPPALAAVYSEDVIVTESRPIVGRQAAAAFVGTRFGRAYDIIPVALT